MYYMLKKCAAHEETASLLTLNAQLKGVTAAARVMEKGLTMGVSKLASDVAKVVKLCATKAKTGDNSWEDSLGEFCRHATDDAAMLKEQLTEMMAEKEVMWKKYGACARACARACVSVCWGVHVFVCQCTCAHAVSD